MRGGQSTEHHAGRVSPPQPRPRQCRRTETLKDSVFASVAAPAPSHNRAPADFSLPLPLSPAQYFHILFRIALHMKVSLVHTLYLKSLRITSSVRSGLGVGPIVNLQSNDAAKLWNMIPYLHVFW